MKIEDIITLIKEVSQAKIINFQIEQGDFKLSMDKNEYKVDLNPVQHVIQGDHKLQGITNESVESQNNHMIREKVEYTSTSVENKANDEITIPTVMQELKEIKSPIVGTFYSSMSPDSEDFVKVGSKVNKGQTLCIIEAMKLMNDIESDYDGEIVEVLVKNEQMVEYNQPLFRIK